jgi:hypothetical protein
MKSNMILGGKKNKLQSVRVIRIIFAVVCCVFISLKANAQQGCYVAATNLIYTDPVLRLNNDFVLPSPHSTVCAAGSTTSTIVYRPSPSGTTICGILASITGPLLASGVLRNYTITNCPLDDYLPLLFVPIALVAVWRIKKQKEELIEGTR